MRPLGFGWWQVAPGGIGALAGRGQSLAITLAEAKLAQQAALRGDTATVRYYQQKLRGAPGKIMADIAIAESIPKALAEGDIARAETLQASLTPFAIRQEIAPIVEQAKQAAKAEQEAAAAAGTTRTLLLAAAAGAIGLSALYWWATR